MLRDERTDRSRDASTNLTFMEVVVDRHGRHQQCQQQPDRREGEPKCDPEKDHADSQRHVADDERAENRDDELRRSQPCVKRLQKAPNSDEPVLKWHLRPLSCRVCF